MSRQWLYMVNSSIGLEGLPHEEAVVRDHRDGVAGVRSCDVSRFGARGLCAATTPILAPAYSWTGCYLGGNGGAASRRSLLGSTFGSISVGRRRSLPDIDRLPVPLKSARPILLPRRDLQKAAFFTAINDVPPAPFFAVEKFGLTIKPSRLHNGLVDHRHRISRSEREVGGDHGQV